MVIDIRLAHSDVFISLSFVCLITVRKVFVGGEMSSTLFPNYQALPIRPFGTRRSQCHVPSWHECSDGSSSSKKFSAVCAYPIEIWIMPQVAFMNVMYVLSWLFLICLIMRFSPVRRERTAQASVCLIPLYLSRTHNEPSPWRAASIGLNPIQRNTSKFFK